MTKYRNLTDEEIADRKWQDEDGEWSTGMDSGEINSTTFKHDGTIAKETISVPVKPNKKFDHSWND